MTLLAATIRPALPRDAGAIRDIYAPFVQHTAVSFEVEVPTETEMLRRMAGDHKHLPWLVADIEGRVAGYAYGTTFRARTAYQWTVEVSVYVDPGVHRRGLGRRLYGELLDRLRSRGYCTAVAGITLPNPASIALHESMGFRAVGVYHRVGFKMDRWHDVGWWELPLQELGDVPPAPPIVG